MRKSQFLLLVLTLIFGMLLAACGGGAAESSVEAPAAEEAAEALAEEAAAEEEAAEEAAAEEAAAEEEMMTGVPVAILVVDDFQTTAVGAEEEGGLCAVAGDGQIFRAGGMIFRAGGMGQDWQKLSNVTHGQLVYSQLAELLEGYFGAPTGMVVLNLMNEEEEITMEVWGADEIFLVPVDTLQYDSGTIAQRLEETMTALISEMGVYNFVWNMSFGFIPCDLELTEEEYQLILENDDELIALKDSLEEYFGEDEEDEVDQFLKDNALMQTAYGQYGGESGLLEEKEIPWPEEDPFWNFLETNIYTDTVNNIIPVAAAGNSGWGFPFAPAHYDGFISVSAEGEDWSLKADYANSGEVIMPDTYSSSWGTVVGTSFAAPELSVRSAYYLWEGYPLDCSGGFEPPLDYGTYDNLPLTNAISLYCLDFPQ